MAGRSIQPLYGQDPQDIIITKFPLEGLDGRKMSSSWGNVINITDKPDDMFGKIMSINDNLIIKYFQLATRIPNVDVEEYKKQLETKTNPKNIKIKLAFELVRMYHGEEGAKKSQEEFDRVFSKKELPRGIKEWRLKKEGNSIVDALTESGTVASKTEAKRLIDQRAIKINSSIIKSWGYKVKMGDVIKVGSRKFLKIV